MSHSVAGDAQDGNAESRMSRNGTLESGTKVRLNLRAPIARVWAAPRQARGEVVAIEDYRGLRRVLVRWGRQTAWMLAGDLVEDREDRSLAAAVQAIRECLPGSTPLGLPGDPESSVAVPLWAVERVLGKVEVE